MKRTISRLLGITMPQSGWLGLGHVGIAVITAAFMPATANAGFTGTGSFNDAYANCGGWTYENFNLTYTSNAPDPTLLNYAWPLMGNGGEAILNQTSGTLIVSNNGCKDGISAICDQGTAIINISGGFQEWMDVVPPYAVTIGCFGNGASGEVTVTGGEMYLNAGSGGLVAIGGDSGTGGVTVGGTGTVLVNAETLYFNAPLGAGYGGNGGFVYFELGTGSLQLSNLVNLDWYYPGAPWANNFNFETGSMCQLGISGYGRAQFDALVTQGLIQCNGQYDGGTQPSQFQYASNAVTGMGIYQLAPQAITSAPTGLSALPAPSNVTLNWNWVPWASSYNVYRSTNSGGNYVLIASDVPATTYVDTTVASGQTYYYTVCGTNSLGDGPDSAQVSALAGPTRQPWLWPFATNSPWNMPIGSGARFASATDPETLCLLNTNLCGFAVNGNPPPVYQGTNCSPMINCPQWSIPVYLAASNDPICQMQVRDVNNLSTAYAYYHIPNNAVASPPAWDDPPTDYYATNANADAHMMVVEPGQQYVNESYHTRTNFYSPGNWLCAEWVQNDLYGPGVGAGGTRAYEGSALGGLMRVWELQAGSVQHALALAMWGTQLTGGPIWPAISCDDTNEYCGKVPEGTLVAIPSSVNISNLVTTAGGLVIARALQNYGAYVVDCGGADAFYAEPAANGMPQLAQMTTDLAKLWGYLRPVTNNSATNIGGGGTPLQPMAPPWGVPKTASSVIPVAYYRLGENDPGAVAGQAADNPTVDMISGVSLSQKPLGTGTAPKYDATTGVNGSSLCIDVDGEGYATNAPFTNGCSTNFLTAGFGIEAWVKAASTKVNTSLTSDGWACIVYDGDDGTSGSGVTDGMGLYEFQGQYMSVVGYGGQYGVVLGGPAVVPGAWTHLAVVATGNATTLYVNGVEWGNGVYYITPGTGVSTGTGPLPTEPTSNFSIGYEPTSIYLGEGFQGSIDEVRVFGVLPGRFSTNDLLLTHVPPGPQAPILLTEPAASPMVFAGGSISLSSAVSGSFPLCYQWYDGGTAISGATGSSLTLTNVTESGNYYVVVTNMYGSVTSSVTSFIVVPAGVNTLIPLAYYRLGENDPGAVAGQPADNPTVDIVNGVNLYQVTTGSAPTYSANTGVAGSSLCLSVTGEGYANNTPIATPANGNWGIEIWVKAQNHASNPYLAPDGVACIVYNGDDGAGGNGMGIFQNSSGNFIGYCASSAGWVGGASVAAGVWTHLAIVTMNGTTTFYVNGIATGTGPAPTPPTGCFGIGYSPYYYVGPSYSEELFQGSLDEARVFAVTPGGPFSTNELLLASVPPALAVGILPVGTNMVVTWSGEVLQQAASVTGPWSTITNATAPCLIPQTGVSQFFRAAGQP